MLDQLLRRAADYLGHSQVSKAVIAVPAKFDARQRSATVEAFRLAGLQVCLVLRMYGEKYLRNVTGVTNSRLPTAAIAERPGRLTRMHGEFAPFIFCTGRPNT